MPKLIKVNTEKIYLPSTENEPNEDDRAFVEMKTQAIGGDMMSAGIGVDNVERTIRLIAALVTNWNFTDEEGKIEPINYETIARLEPQDFTVLAVKVKDIVNKSSETKLPQDEEKKTTSTDTLTPSTTPIVPQT